MSFDKH